MPLEKFINQRLSNTATITIRRVGKISFNIHARRQFRINRTHFVTLYFDEETGEIGIKPTTNKDEPGIFKITQKRGGTPLIYCKSFLDRYGIPCVEKPIILGAHWDSEKEMIMARLSVSTDTLTRSPEQVAKVE